MHKAKRVTAVSNSSHHSLHYQPNLRLFRSNRALTHREEIMTDPTAGAATNGAKSNSESTNKRAAEAPSIQPAYQPTARDLILLELPTDIKVSPDGQHAAVVVRTTNWRENRYESICYLCTNSGQRYCPLNRSGSIQQVEWIDAQTVALLKCVKNGDAQVWLHEGNIGEGWQVTAHEGGVHWFAPFANGLLYRANRKENDADTKRTEMYGNFKQFEQEESRTALYYVDLSALRDYERRRRHATPAEADKLIRPLLELSSIVEEPCSIRSVVPCPTGQAIYLNCWRRDDLVYYNQSKNYLITLNPEQALATYLQREAEKCGKATADQTGTRGNRKENDADEDLTYLGELTQLQLPLCADVVAISPDGQSLLIDHQGRDDRIFTRSDLWILEKAAVLSATDVESSLQQMRNISAPLDRDLSNVQWTPHGIFAAYVDGVHIRLAHFTADGTITPLNLQNLFSTGAFDVTDGGQLGFIGVNASRYPDAYLATTIGQGTIEPPHQLTNYGAAITDWQLGTIETIRWQSKDGTEIEGVLRKPINFDPNKRYPLVFVVHGGPRGYADASLITHVDRSYYPSIQFANADVLVLYPNYRGSTGRGQAFTELNVNNLGVGDLWDLESAIDYLAGQGWIDETRIGCMGWSQGGYISAFAGLHSERFCAVSVGAGISDWYTYHISNDIPYFTTDYLSGSPFHNRDYYAPTAPMSNITNAKTPMLIQHGSDDRRVPLSNAMELYRGLQAMDVPVELYIYPGMGHPITRPRENHAVMNQNWEWFAKYLLGNGEKLHE